MYTTEILGQELPRKLLLKAYDSGRIAHSYLFTGPSGTGKLSMAYWFSALLNCRAEDLTHNPCGDCISCKKLISTNHPDIRFIYPDPETQNIKIDQIRALQKEANFLPVESLWKIFIIRNAHRMVEAAANCFLKILEEPPGKTITILTSTSLYQLLPTIISRCQIVKFTPVEAHLLSAYLVEKEGIPPDRSLVFAHISQGSVGRAINLSKKEGLWELRKRVIDHLNMLPALPASEILLFADKFPKDRENVELVIEMILSWFRDLLCIKEDPGFSSQINLDRVAQIKSQSGELTYWQIINCVNYIKDAQEQLRSQVNTGFLLQRLFMGIHKVEVAPGLLL